MITILLEQIIQLLQGWISAFSDHAQHVEDKLDSIDSTASDIKDNTDSLPDIEDNTAAVITPINNIKTNTDSIASSNTAIANNTTAISNQGSAISTNVGRAAAYAEDCANNSLNILDKVTTIASDTTQIRTDTGNMSLEQSKIYDAVKWLLADKEIEETESADNSVTFDTDMTEDLVDLTVGLVATQSGTGTPTPDNIRPIVGYSTMGLTVNENAVSISLGNTYYGGILDVTTGILTITWGYIPDLSTQSWQFQTGTTTTFRSVIPNIVSPTTPQERIKGLMCSAYSISTNYSLTNVDNLGMIRASSYVLIRNDSYTTVESFKLSLSGISFAYELATPVIVSLTPQQIATIKGVNTITTDTNGEIVVTYKESIKHYLDKQDNA